MLSRVLVACFLGLIGLALGGCAGTEKVSTEVAVAPGRYAEAFEAAKDVLRDYQFDLDRVDAVSGVVTTHGRGSSGFATPWIPHGTSFGDGVSGAIERERRVAAVVFTSGAEEVVAERKEVPEAEGGVDKADAIEELLPGAVPGAGPGAAALDSTGEVRARVTVWVERVYSPGRRVSATSVRLSSFTSDPELREQGLEPSFAVQVREDAALGARLARDIGARLQTKAR